MATTIVHLVMCAVLLKGVLGLPFASEEEANQFLGLKRQTPYLDYWQLTSSQSTLAEQVSETWAALKRSAQQYMDSGLFTFDTDTARNHISSYMDMLDQSEAGLRQQKRQPRDIKLPGTDEWDLPKVYY